MLISTYFFMPSKWAPNYFVVHPPTFAVRRTLSPALRWPNRCVLVVGHKNTGRFRPSVCQSVTPSDCHSVSPSALSDSVHINTPSQDIIYKQMQLSFLWRISGAGNCDDEILCDSHKCRQTKPAQIESKREEFSERERERQGATLSLAGNRITLSV